MTISGFTATIGNGRISLNWDAVIDAAFYVAQWKSGVQSFDVSREMYVDSNAAVINGLSNGTEYTFRVRSVTNADASEPVLYDSTAAAVDAGGMHTFNITIDEAGDYVAQIRVVDKVGLTSDWVSPSNASLTSEYNVATAATISLGSVTPPSNFSITDFTISWDTVSGATGYQYTDAPPDAGTVWVDVSGFNSLTLDSDSYNVAEEYQLWFRTVDGSDYSYANFYLAIPEDSDGPAAPDALIVNKIGDGFQMQWTKPDDDDLDFWVLTWIQDSTTVYSQTGSYIENTDQLVGSDVFEPSDDGDVSVTVKYTDIYGNEGSGITITFELDDGTAPSFTGSTIDDFMPFITSADQKITYAWTPISAILNVHYQLISIYEVTDDDATGSKVVDSYLLPHDAVSYTAPDLPYGATYRGVLEIADQAGNRSDPFTFANFKLTDGAPPSAASSFNLIAADNLTARATWERPSGVADLAHFNVGIIS